MLPGSHRLRDLSATIGGVVVNVFVAVDYMTKLMSQLDGYFVFIWPVIDLPSESDIGFWVGLSCNRRTPIS